ncbi:DUF1801 domain-containing protein [Hyphobacterium sp.]|uniref:DUF1801 domain-containing protein n=1 Tax=Hyphobacterium sp. TaxID=2004662 RepID=UPI003BAC68B4
MEKPSTIEDYHLAQSETDRAICDALRQEIDRGLPGAESKMWHAHPVWFLNDNPIVGYGKLKDCIRLMFWSGQSFQTPGLKPDGSFKVASARFTHPDQIDRNSLQAWLIDSREVQWDYKNIVKRKGRLERLS